MIFRLALAMGRTVGELVDSMTSAEFTEWLAFFRLEPWGHDVEYHRAGQTAAMVYNVNRGQNDRALSAMDFVPGYVRPPMSPEEMINKMKGL